MKKFAAGIAFVILAFSLCGCSALDAAVEPKLDTAQQSMLDTVMSNLDMWETRDGKNAVYVQLQEISGSYCLCVGYDDSTSIEQDEAVYTFSYDFTESYNLDNGSMSWFEGGSMVVPAENYMWGGAGTGRKAIGNSFWNITDSYDSKYSSMEALLLKLVEE